MTTLRVTAAGTANSMGVAMIVFQPPPQGHINTGTLTVTNAEPSASWTASIGASVVANGPVPVPLGSFLGPSAFGPVQALDNDVITVVGNNLIAGKQYICSFIGSIDIDDGTVPVGTPPAPSTSSIVSVNVFAPIINATTLSIPITGTVTFGSFYVGFAPWLSFNFAKFVSGDQYEIFMYWSSSALDVTQPLGPPSSLIAVYEIEGGALEIFDKLAVMNNWLTITVRLVAGTPGDKIAMVIIPMAFQPRTVDVFGFDIINLAQNGSIPGGATVALSPLSIVPGPALFSVFGVGNSNWQVQFYTITGGTKTSLIFAAKSGGQLATFPINLPRTFWQCFLTNGDPGALNFYAALTLAD